MIKKPKPKTEEEYGKMFFESSLKQPKIDLASFAANGECNGKYEGEHDKIRKCIQGIDKAIKEAKANMEQEKTKTT